MEEIEIVIGSWGSYNECNERSLGSKWLRLSEYSNWEEIETELKNQGFILDGIDEELDKEILELQELLKQKLQQKEGLS